MQQIYYVPVIQFQNILKEKLKQKLEILFWDDPYAYSQLCKYCETMKIEKDAKRTLISRGILDKKGDLPVITRKAVYELTTGLTTS